MTDDELRGLLEALRQDSVATREESAAARRESVVAREETAAARQESAAAHAETRRLFSETVERIATENRHFFAAGAEGLRHEIQLVAEGVAATREQLVRTAADHAERIERVGAETQAMIKFSHADLDRRMRTLEEVQRTLEDALSDLQSRVERLESGTH